MHVFLSLNWKKNKKKIKIHTLFEIDHSLVVGEKCQKILCTTEIKVMTSRVDAMDLAHGQSMD